MPLWIQVQIDASYLYRRDKEEGSPELNLHMTLNDIKPESIARR